MKKVYAFVATLTTAFSLTACGNTNEESISSSVANSITEISETETVEYESNSDLSRTDVEISKENISDAETSVSYEESSESAGNEENSKVLIAYFTLPEDVDPDGADAIAGASIVVNNGKIVGNTEYIANIIQQTIGGDLFEITTEKDYPLDHEPLVDEAKQEQQNSDRPALISHIGNLDEYDTIIIGYPNWWGDMPMPVFTFLEEYDFSGKTIIPYCPHGGSRFSNTVAEIAELQPNAVVSDNGFLVERNDVINCADDVIDWINSIF